MSDPIRLLDDPSAPGSVTELVRAIQAPTPLGEAGKAALAARITASAATAPVVAAKLLTLKAGIAALVAGGGLALLVTALEAPQPAPAPPPVVAVTPATPTPKIEVAPPAPPVAEPAPAEPTQRAPNARPTSPKDTLALEESLLERAREALGTPSRALALLAEHERRFPSGELTAERLYLSARAHQKAGNTAQAQKYARSLAHRFPKSTYLAGLRPLLNQ